MYSQEDLTRMKAKLHNKRTLTDKTKEYLLTSDMDLKDKFIIALSELSSQMYGPLLEKLVIKELSMERVSSRENRGDCKEQNRHFEIKTGMVNKNVITLFQVRLYQDIKSYISVHYDADNDKLIILNIEKEKMGKICNKINSSSHGSGEFKNGEKQVKFNIKQELINEFTLSLEELKEYVG